jgi:hypothetical protein
VGLCRCFNGAEPSPSHLAECSEVGLALTGEVSKVRSEGTDEGANEGHRQRKVQANSASIRRKQEGTTGGNGARFCGQSLEHEGQLQQEQAGPWSEGDPSSQSNEGAEPGQRSERRSGEGEHGEGRWCAPLTADSGQAEGEGRGEQGSSAGGDEGAKAAQDQGRESETGMKPADQSQTGQVQWPHLSGQHTQI